MGILRTILALAVVVYHSYKVFGLRMCGGQVAVESFYMISGFYMALILNEKYTGKSYYRKFILSRAFRIFPVYWVVLVLAVVLSITGYFISGHSFYLFRYINHVSCLSPHTLIYFILENVVILGQDVLYFLKLNDHCVPELTYNVLSFKHTGYQYLFVPQAWTISLEFMFYLIAPFLVTKDTFWQISLALIGFLTKYYFSSVHYLSFDPWTYRFFPFELAYFLAGSIAYRVYQSIISKKVSPYFGYFFALVVSSVIIFYNEINISSATKNFTFYLFLFLAIPFIFYSFKDNKIDRYIGELSFSLYICHHLVVSVLRSYFFSHTHLIAYYGYFVLLISLILSILMYHLFIQKLERYRHKSFS